MANIPLKSIKFPDLADTYTVPSNAGELPYNKSATYPADTVGKALQNIGDSSAPAILETATGSIASFTDGANVPVKDLVAEIVPVQSGSGDPSPDNVRPITGWTEAEIHVADGENPHIVDNVTTINWQSQAGTVYGGSIGVTTGVLTVDRVGVDLGACQMSWGGSYSRGTITLPSKYPNDTNDLPMICSKYKYDGIGDSGTGYFGDNNTFRYYFHSNDSAEIYVKDESCTTAEEFRTAMNGVIFSYPLATPQTYQLTPTEVKTLLKNNNIWADTGDVTVEYVADTKTFIENLVNA